MGIEYSSKYEGMTATCDYCGEKGESVGATYQEAWAELKELGWRAKKAWAWINICPECVRKGATL